MKNKFSLISKVVLCSLLSVTSITTVFAEGDDASPTPTSSPVPTVEPTSSPVPTVEPTTSPVPTVEPTTSPVPTVEPTSTPTAQPTSTPTEDPDDDAETGYYVVDGNGNKIQSYFYDGQYDLFLTEACSLDDLTIYSTKKMAITTNGTISKDQKSVVGDFSKETQVEIELVNKEKTTVKVMQSNLPSLFIDLDDANGVTLEKIHSDKEIKYSGNTVVLTDSENSSNNLNIENVQIGGRGNTSWQLYEKKGYQIKFEKKTNVLGLGKAKKWVLLANSTDASMMMNKLAYDLSSSLEMDYATSGEYVDLWIEGDYRGTYLVSDKVEIGDNRVELDENGVLSELDNEFYRKEVYQQDLFGNHFVLKDPDVEEVGDNFNQFINAMNTAEELLPTADWSKFTELVDVESLAKMYLINEYMANNEYTVTSNYWYYDGTIHAGPVWDFDTSTYLQSSPDQLYVYNLSIFSQLIVRPEFMDLVNEIYKKYNVAFNSLSYNAFELKNTLARSAEMNYIRWDVLGTDVPKAGTFEKTYEANVAKLNNWLTARYKLFKTPEVNATFNLDIADDRDTVTVLFTSKTAINGNVRVGFWNEKDGTDDCIYYPAESVGNNTYKATIYLSNHDQYGNFSVQVLVNNDSVFSRNYVVRNLGTNTGWEQMFRLYNPNSSEHFYTSSAAERTALVQLGWNYEGVGWRAPTSGDKVYRLYNPNAGDHHYTVSVEEKNYLVSVGWNDEGVGWCSDVNKTVPLYRQYNPNAVAGAHNYTVNAAERDYLIRLGWKNENIGWYGV